VVAAQVIGVHPAFDLALLQLPASGLKQVEWAGADPVVASILVAPAPADLPLAVGVVSAGRRDVPGPHPTTVVRVRRESATLPNVIGSAVQGRGYWVEYAEGEADRTGIEPGDVILSIGGTPVRSHEDLAACVRGRMAGDRVAVRLVRAGKNVELPLTLQARSAAAFTPSRGYPTVFEHDLPLDAAECGGPVVGLDGTALGVTVARVSGSGCIAVPADMVRRLLPSLKAGKPLAALPTIKAAPGDGAVSGGPTGNRSGPVAGRPVNLTLDALRQKLAERRDQFRSLSVEYDVVSEAHVAPLQLLNWNLHLVRDYHERHREAFAGTKRFQEVQGPSVMPFYAPGGLAAPDANAPPDIKRAVEDLREEAASRGKDDIGRLFARVGEGIALCAGIRQREAYHLQCLLHFPERHRGHPRGNLPTRHPQQCHDPGTRLRLGQFHEPGAARDALYRRRAGPHLRPHRPAAPPRPGHTHRELPRHAPTREPH
jgi:serine protease Do